MTVVRHEVTFRPAEPGDLAAVVEIDRAAGFEEVGIQRRHGKLEGQWKDCVLVEHLLGVAASIPAPARPS